jgi:hypothetical protein
MPKYLVETISIFRIRHVVEANEASHANDEVLMRGVDFPEFSQKHIDELITSTREITDEEYLKLFDEDNDYLKDWEESSKFKFVSKINYDE